MRLNKDFIQIEYEKQIHFINYDRESVFKLGIEDSIILRTYIDSDSTEDFIQAISSKYSNPQESIKTHLDNILNFLTSKGIYQ